MSAYIIFSYLFYSILCLILSFFFNKNFFVKILVLFSFFNFFLSIFVLYESILTGGQTTWVDLFSWSKHLLVIDFALVFDSLSLWMIFIVTFISSVVQMYSLNYMGNDPHLNRFVSFLLLFTFFMLLFLVSTNFIQMFLGWEGVGLSSYLLINFWYTRVKANKSALKAMFLNRIGDVSLLIAISLMYSLSNSFDFFINFAYVEVFSNFQMFVFGHSTGLSLLDLICFFFLIGVLSKSAQFILHVWLPDAMEGPTPVSALLHAATMVTAGVYLLIRLSWLFEFSEINLNIIFILGTLTALFGSTIGFFQSDMKKIIAYSTCSQLGYMVLACGMSCYSVAFFHLINHAFFKALLFLASGSLIHYLNSNQDIRTSLKINGPGNLFLTLISFILGSLSLMGFPFFSGFFSKDCIIEITSSWSYWNSNFFFF